jgi:hypothetical protein
MTDLPRNDELVEAAGAGDLETVKRLIEGGADPNSEDKHGIGSLLNFDPEVTRYLLEHGADPDLQVDWVSAIPGLWSGRDSLTRHRVAAQPPFQPRGATLPDWRPTSPGRSVPAGPSHAGCSSKTAACLAGHRRRPLARCMPRARHQSRTRPKCGLTRTET